MNKRTRTVFNCILSAITCLLLVGLAIPSVGNATVPASTQEAIATTPTHRLIEAHLVANLRDAESSLLAQAASSSEITQYVAVLDKINVVGTTPGTSAFGTAGAVLVGDRLIVRGDFSNLSSGLRDYAVDPVSPPNPNITSAVHIHQGEPSANGPFQYALTVMLDDTELKGRFSGEYTLTGEQLQALSDGLLYVDIHTTKNRAGELRGIFKPY